MKKKILSGALILALSLTASGCTYTESVFNETTTPIDANLDTVSNSNSDDVKLEFSERDYDTSYKKDVTNVNLSTVGSEYKITAKGTYVLSGSMEGMIVVDAADAKVQIVLNNANIHNSSNAAIYVKKADKVFITLESGSTNSLKSDAFASLDDNNIDGVIFCKSDLTINGDGSLSVDSTAAKGHGIVCKDELKFTSGNIDVKASKTAIMANDFLGIDGADIVASAGTKGLHCDAAFKIMSGSVKVTKSNEGIEAMKIYVAGGVVDVTSDDDGFNATDGSGRDMGMMRGAGPSLGATSEMLIDISGGKVYINADGDGLDSNGSILISGGETYINGPTNDGNGALDMGASGSITGGILVAVGSSGMAETLESDAQGVIQVNVSGNAGDKIVLSDSSNTEILSWTADKKFSNVVISTPAIKENGTYKLTVGGTTNEVTLDGFTYSEGGMRGFGGKGQHNFNGDRQDMFNGGVPEDFNGRMPDGFDRDNFRDKKNFNLDNTR